jgi:cobalamin biosynthesis protein CobT
MKATYKGYELRQGVETFAHKLCKALGRKPVRIAWVDWTSTAGISQGGDMVLADIADDAVVTRQVFEQYCGFVAHELCHHAYTDFNARASVQYIDQLHNAVEDAWIEHKAIRLNMTGNIENLFSALAERMVSEALDAVTDWSNPQQYPFVLAMYLRDHAKTKVPLAVGLEPIFEQAKAMLIGCNNSYDTLKVAKWVFEQLKKNGKGKGQGQGQGQPQGEGQGQDGTGQDGTGQEGTQEGQGKGNKADKGQGQGQPTGKGDKPLEDGSKADGEGDNQGQGEGQQQGQQQGEGQGTDAEGEGKGAGNAKPVDEDTIAVEVEPTNSAPEGKGGIGSYEKDSSLVDSDWQLRSTSRFDVKVNIPAKLRYTVKRLFENSGLEEFQRNRKSGSVNVHALTKLGFSDRLFKRRLETDGIDSAVVICLDISDSMFTDEADYARIRSAVKTTYALLETMSKAGVSTSVLAFGRFTSVLKPWNMPIPKIGDLLGKVKSEGSTNDYFAVRYAHEMLLARPEVRKICFSITDGIGNTNRVRLQCESGARLGITTIGVGIGMSVHNAYPQNVTVMKTEDLGTTSFEKIKLVA